MATDGVGMRRRDLLAGIGALMAWPAWAEDRRPVARPARLDRMLAASRLGAGAELGVAVMNPHGGPVLDRGADVPLPPASTLKTVTALYALDRLGAGHRFATRVLRDGDRLILAGGADPELDTDGLAALALDAARAAGDWRPARFAVWGGALPRLDSIAAGQAAHLAYNPAISGIILNFNRVHLGWRCAEACTLSLEARADGRSPRAYSITAGLRPGGGAWRHATADGVERWDVPRAQLGEAGSRWLPVRRPESYAGDLFQTLARAAGWPLPAPEVLDALPAGAQELARRDGRPLTDVLQSMLEFSTNLTAEVVGLAASGADNLPSSGQAMADWLSATGAGEAVLADHSGLSAESRIAPGVLARLLAQPQAAAELRPLLKSDPLRDVLGKASGGDGKGGHPRVSAKTGTLNFVSNLAGYATGPDGTERVFAVMVADLQRQKTSAGSEFPDGVLGWTARAKRLQRDVIAAACQSTAAARPLPPEI